MRAWVAAAGCVALLAGCGGGGTSGERAAPVQGRPSAAAALGEKIFKDASLSASGRLACATCHDEGRAHGPANALPAQMGGPLLDRQGVRASPSIRYLAFNTPFYIDAEGTPTGGFFWDGRAGSLQDQASRPFLDAAEMANDDAEQVVQRLAKASYADEFRALYGADIFDRPGEAFARATLAVQQYQREDVAFAPFSSKYDEFLRGRATLSAQEQRGLALFNAPGKGNCAGCHPSARGPDGSLPLFTDFTYDNLGVPRNPALSRNADPAYFDLGLCSSAGMESFKDLCGAFKVPSLRNVAQRPVFFHNGRFTSLKETLTFYVQRDTHPEKFYPVGADGQVRKFDDLPDIYRRNVNTTEAPYNRRPGDAPALSDAEIDDVIAFLKTLNDGYVQP